MTQQQGIGIILKEVLSEEESTSVAGNSIFVAPVRHIVSKISERSAGESRVYLEWHLHPTFVFDISTMFWGPIGAKKTKYFMEAVSFQGNIKSNRLCRQVREEVLPVFRSNSTIQSYYQHTMNRAFSLSLRPEVHFMMEVALGNFDAAEILMRWHRERWLVASGKTGQRISDYRLTLTLCDLLDRGDIVEIGRGLREAEAANAEKLGILQLWQPSLFPFEADADGTAV